MCQFPFTYDCDIESAKQYLSFNSTVWHLLSLSGMFHDNLCTCQPWESWMQKCEGVEIVKKSQNSREDQMKMNFNQNLLL